MEALNTEPLQIQLPGQTEQVKWLTFTPVEQHFYNRQHEDCSATASKVGPANTVSSLF